MFGEGDCEVCFNHRIHGRWILMVGFVLNFYFFAFIVALCGPVHRVETIHDLC